MRAFDKNTPYNNLPPLPPRMDIETKAVLRKTITAGRKLAEMNRALRTLPNPTLFIDTIYMQEARASSEVENIITTNDELYRSLVSDYSPEYAAAKEVLCYKEALWLGMRYIAKKPFITTNLCVSIVQCITGNTDSIRKLPGTTLSNTRGEVVYTPPTGEKLIRDKMARLEKFINTNDSLDPLIKMALMHYQFEAIHPFADGNGRTGRVLLLLYLKLSGLLETPAIYLSEYIIRNRVDYYKRLREVTEKGYWEKYILFMLDMVEETAISGLKRLNDINAAIDKMSGEMRKSVPKIYSRELVETIFRLPYTKRQVLMEGKLGNAKTVGNYLRTLEQKGFLKSSMVGKEKLYLNSRLMKILDETSLGGK